MSTSSASTNSTIPAVVGSAAVQSPVSDELFVRVKTGGMELALRAKPDPSIFTGGATAPSARNEDRVMG